MSKRADRDRIEADDALRAAAVEYARTSTAFRHWLNERNTVKATTADEVQKIWRPMYVAEMKLMRAAIELANR